MTVQPYDTVAAREVLEGKASMDQLRTRCTSRQIAFTVVVMLHIAGRTDFPKRGLYGELLGRLCNPSGIYPERTKYMSAAKLMGLHDSGGRGQYRMKLVEHPEVTAILNDEALMRSCRKWCTELVEKAEQEYFDDAQRMQENAARSAARAALLEGYNASHSVLQIPWSYGITPSEIHADIADLQELLRRPEFSEE